jgi:hypothetical protein
LERAVEATIFVNLILAKPRRVVCTLHAIERAMRRGITDENQIAISRFEIDVMERIPYLVMEQDSEHISERKFKTYYRAQEGGFIVYIVAINDHIRLISTYRTSKKLQEEVYACEKRWQKRKRKQYKSEKGDDIDEKNRL